MPKRFNYTGRKKILTEHRSIQIRREDNSYYFDADLQLDSYHFDPNAGVYSVQAKRLASVMGVITVAVILSITVPYWVYDSRRTAARKEASHVEDSNVGVEAESDQETDRRSAELAEVVS